ncbi:unnamed protein product [Trichogramma brassicae]|uniref:Uncharacterized protein n=1 Tax=Trichogramma brassicae TaxID=86971 RepID=A0A6H5IZ94_9HYME|nr:unnamed protein product [Trichogramma brassicae]
MLQIDARDKSGCTPLQWAVASLMPKAIDILINNGADLSSFTYPDESHFNEIYHLSINKFALRPVAGALATIERLRERGYELDQSDALKIMKIFAIYGLFKKSTDVLKSLYDDKKFVSKATELMVKPDLSFYKLIQLQSKEIEAQTMVKKRQVKYVPYSQRPTSNTFPITTIPALPTIQVPLYY